MGTPTSSPPQPPVPQWHPHVQPPNPPGTPVPQPHGDPHIHPPSPPFPNGTPHIQPHGDHPPPPLTTLQHSHGHPVGPGQGSVGAAAGDPCPVGGEGPEPLDAVGEGGHRHHLVVQPPQGDAAQVLVLSHRLWGHITRDPPNPPSLVPWAPQPQGTPQSWGHPDPRYTLTPRMSPLGTP